MPYLPTSQSYLEQSSLLLQAYPDTTRITTKYTFPSTHHTPKPTTQTPSQPATQPAPIATLTLKTFNPSTGICLKYRTNKAAEVGRLMTSLGKLAAGADVKALGVSGGTVGVGSGAGAGAGVGNGDVEMGEVGGEDLSVSATATATAGTGTGTSAGKGGKSKKKGGKGKK